jgi:hypothetical protein
MQGGKVSNPSARLHRKLYRAKAIDIAMATAMEDVESAKLNRKRDGDYSVITLTGVEGDDGRELLAEVCDLALQLTVEQDK